jgi:hypothetical protein
MLNFCCNSTPEVGLTVNIPGVGTPFTWIAIDADPTITLPRCAVKPNIYPAPLVRENCLSTKFSEREDALGDCNDPFTAVNDDLTRLNEESLQVQKKEVKFAGEIVAETWTLSKLLIAVVTGVVKNTDNFLLETATTVMLDVAFLLSELVTVAVTCAVLPSAVEGTRMVKMETYALSGIVKGHTELNTGADWVQFHEKLRPLFVPVFSS